MHTFLINSYDDLDQWITELDDLGVDTAKLLAPVFDAKARLGTLLGFRAKFRTEPRMHALGVRLAADPGDYDTTIAAILMASISSAEGVLNKVSDAFDECESIAAQEAITAFRKTARGPLLDELGDLLAEVLADVAASKLPPGVLSLEAATRSGVGDRYLALEQAGAKHHAIGGLLASWRSREISDHALAWQNPGRLKDVPAAPAGVWLSLAVEAGAERVLISGPEADAISGQSDHGTREAMWDRQDATQLAQEQAAEAARHYTHPVPDRRLMPGAGARAR